MKSPLACSRASVAGASAVHAPVSGSNTAADEVSSSPVQPYTEYTLPSWYATRLSWTSPGKSAIGVHGSADGLTSFWAALVAGPDAAAARFENVPLTLLS